MKQHSTTFIIGLSIIAGAYWYFSAGTNEQPSLSASSAGVENLAQTKFQTLVSELQPISFNADIFSDPNFTALTDLTTPVVPEPSGRLDPFAQVSATTK